MSMEAVEFIRERNRMCKAFLGCKGCPACDFDGCGSVHLNEGIIPIVEKWAKEHPRKTRQSVFLKQWPNADISDDGLPDVAPCQLCVGLIHGESTEDCENRGLCVECRREFWMQEVE